MKNIAILIPVYNRISYTKKSIRTLEGLVKNEIPRNNKYSIIVIDDGSSDGTGDWLAKEYPDVIVLKGGGNLWWSGGINVGATFAISEIKADFLLLWNNDVYPAPDYFIELDSLISSIPERTIAGSKIFFLNRENVINAFGGIFNPRNGVKYLVGYNLPDSTEFNHPIEVDWLSGMGSLIPTSVIDEVGLWDEKTFPQYQGDSDFTLRAKKAGYKIMAYPQLKLWRDRSSSGLSHGGTLKGLYLSLTNIRSHSCVSKNFLFYKRHATSLLAYREFIMLYIRLVGGFFKWKFLSLFGRTRTE
jgi:GT2 family glycosyltransferase